MTNKEIVDYFKVETGIEIPDEVIEFYSKNETRIKDSFLFFEFKRIKKGEKPWTITLIDEKLAKEIIRLVDIYIKNDGIESVFNLIKNNQFNGIKNFGVKNDRLINLETKDFHDDDLEEFVFNEILYTVNDYDFKKEGFNFSLVHEAFENLNSDVNLIKCALILNSDCGGATGLIVKGKNAGYTISYYHGAYYKDLIHRGKTIEYQGFLDDEWERPYS